MIVSCKSCVFENREADETPCWNCFYNGSGEKPTKYIPKVCGNCKYHDISMSVEPCKSCINAENAKNAKNEYSNFELPENALYELPNGTILELKEKTETKEENNAVQHPAHYQGKYECIDEMRALFGDNAVRYFCMCSVYEYRFRASKETGEEHEKDIAKAEWYMGYLMEMENERRSRQEVF